MRGKFEKGLVLTLMVLLAEGDSTVVVWPDKSSVSTADGNWAAQFSHTVVITDDGAEVLTERTDESVPFIW